MPQSTAIGSERAGKTHVRKKQSKLEPRYTVSLPSGMAKQVARYAESREASMSKAIASLVRLGLDHQEQRKRDFFQKLKANLADDNPERQDRVIDDFRALILGR